MRRYRIVHATEYSYQQAVTQSLNIAYTLPRQAPWQTVISEEVTILPAPRVHAEELDWNGNRRIWFQIDKPHHRLFVESILQVDVLDLTPNHPGFPDSPESPPLEEFLRPSPNIPMVAEVAAFAQETCCGCTTPLEMALALMKRIHREFTFESGVTNITTKPAELLRLRTGVCQDFAHLSISCLRHLGVPARYVSGYLETHPQPGHEKLRGVDASHAWVAFHDDTGWRAFDPTNNLFPCNSHVVVAQGRDYSDVSPVRGIVDGGGDQFLKVSVDMELLT